MSRWISAAPRAALVALALLFLSADAPAQHAPPGINPTHYWTYRLVDPVTMPASFIAADQFYTAGVPLSVDRLERLVNWVHKNGSPVLPDTLLHYTWWNIPQKLPTPRAVRVINQFGAYDVNVQQLEFMLVPAWKNQPQATFPQANHYLCYRAFGFPGPTFNVSLVDEWRLDNIRPFGMEYLCNPCMKQHGGQAYPPVDTRTHLALYRLPVLSDVFLPFMQDQFFSGIRPVRQSPDEYLLVPSEKLDVATPAKPGTWGRVKTLYR